ncbi:MAG: tRNA (N6-isopentenyl adenosine(37)-C2)-methylthiotransferase MiaB [Spirochaetaceae bacterium]|nr:tRNA (N6-isopentenyl adenosine(37)-C2)-methylthiotransferase MiaB [Spirochaetaceae bacterium]
MTYFFETYGCEMNKAESASVEQLLIARGWTAAPNAEVADLAIINTCSVRETAETRIHGRLGWYSALKLVREKDEDAKYFYFPAATEYVEQFDKNPPKITLVVMGCMAERLLKTFKKKHPVIDYVVGNFQKHQFSEIITALENGKKVYDIEEQPVYQFAKISYEKGAFSTFVPIMHGCNNFCSYCIVPYVRGREVSRSPFDILKEIEQLSLFKVKEITLLGQNVNSFYWKDDVIGEVTFPRLLEMIAQKLREINSSIEWVRFTSSHPKDVSDELIDVLSRERIFCRHIHLPVQHGSNAILKAMNRKYTREDYLTLVEKIRSKLPDVSLSTDILLGFPGETEEDFQLTLQLVKDIGYEMACMYYYNPREGTAAYSFENQVPLDLKKSRLKQLIDMQQEIGQQEMRKRVGSEMKVLVECVSRDNEKELLARTEQDGHVVFTGDASLIGSFVWVKITELTGNTFRGIVK